MNKKTIILAILMVATLLLLLFSARMANRPVKSKKTPAAKETTNKPVVSTRTETTTEPKTETTAGKETGQTPEENPETAPVSKADFWKETVTLLEKSKQARTPLYYHLTKRDPMQPAFAYAEAGPFKLMLKGGMTSASLTGILLGNGKAIAIINEKILRVGDLVDGKKIIAIERNRVILKRGMDEEILRMENN